MLVLIPVGSQPETNKMWSIVKTGDINVQNYDVTQYAIYHPEQINSDFKICIHKDQILKHYRLYEK